MSSEYTTQECNECNRELSLHEFNYIVTRGTHFPKCKECTKNRRKRYYQKDGSMAFSSWRKRPQ